MEQVTYQCSVCKFPITANSPNCPACGSHFSVAQGTTPRTLGFTELAVAAAFGIAMGVIIGVKGARSK
jgi:predicted amidophosphoribosyltransferase